MPPTGRFPLNNGALGISFADVNGVPTVSDIDKDTCQIEMVAIGYRFLSLTLDNGAILENMSTFELVEALQRSRDHRSRYLKLELCLPASTVVILPPGPHGLILTDREEDGRPMVVGVVPGYSGEIRVGMMVDRLRTSDGLEIAGGYSARVYSDVLSSSEGQSQRTVTLVSPETTPSLKSRVLPSFQQVSIGPGSATDLGLSSLGDNCTITSGDSLGAMQRGFRVHTLTTEEGHQFRNVPPDVMTQLLDLTADQTGRSIVLKNPEKLSGAAPLSLLSQWKMALPDRGTASDLGLTFDGSPTARLVGVSRSSPLNAYLNNSGSMIVTKVSWDGTAGPEFEGLDAHDVTEILSDSSGFPQRLLWFTSAAEEEMYQSIPQRGDSPSVVHSAIPDTDQPSVASSSRNSKQGGGGSSVASRRSVASSVAGSSSAAALVNTAGGSSVDASAIGAQAAAGSSSIVEELLLPEEEEEEELPDELMVQLEPGRLGAIFQDQPPLLMKLAPDSMLREMGVPIGMTVDYLQLPSNDGQEMMLYTNMETMELVNALKASADQEGRLLRFINAETMPLTEDNDDGNAIIMVGDDDDVIREEEDPPQQGVMIPVTRRSPSRSPTGSRTGGSQTGGSQNGYEFLGEITAIDELENIEEQQQQYDNDANIIELPPGPIGLIFSKDRPAHVKKIKDGSVLEGIVEPGMMVDTMETPDGTKYYNLDGTKLASLLKRYKEVEGRKVRFITADMEITPSPGRRVVGGGSSSVASSNASSGIIVPLPTGKLGMSFRGKKKPPAVISKIRPGGPMEAYNINGKAIDTLTMGDDGNNAVHFEMNAEEVTNLLQSTSDKPGRVMKVRDPSSTRFKTLPDEMTVVLPTGSLLCSIAGTPPHVKSFKDGSPIAGIVPPKMFIDAIQMPNGYTRKGMSAVELVQLLGSHRAVEGRTLVLKNSKTQQPSSEPEETFPDELVLTLPSGKLGISFKGRTARVSRIHSGSILADQLYVGMLVDTVDIPGSSLFSGVKASEASRILKDTSRVEGRVLTLRAPSCAEVLQPRDDDALEASNYSTSQRN